MSDAIKNKPKQAYLYEGLTYRVRGAIFAVHNELGCGHKEKVYQVALANEFKDRKIPFEKEKRIRIIYKNKKVGYYQPDFLINKQVIIELKSVPFLSKKAEAQLFYYLKGTPYRVGLLVNFGSIKVDIRRKVWLYQ